MVLEEQPRRGAPGGATAEVGEGAGAAQPGEGADRGHQGALLATHPLLLLLPQGHDVIVSADPLPRKKTKL